MASFAAPEQELAICIERRADLGEIIGVPQDCLKREAAGAERDLARRAMRDDVDRAQPIDPAERVGDLPYRVAGVIERDGSC